MSSPKKENAKKTPDQDLKTHEDQAKPLLGQPDKKSEPLPLKAGDVSQSKPEDIIKTYKLKEGEYSINVKIMEATDLVPKKSPMFTFENKDSSANPYVQVEFLGEVRKTKVQKKTLSAVYNEQFFFEKRMKKVELEEASIVFTIMDSNGLLGSDTVIGSFELDITSVYFSYQHELYLATLVLVDPTVEDFSSPSGMLKVSVQVLGPDDEPPVHDINFKKNPVGGAEGQVLRPLKCKPIGHEIEFSIYRAEHLPITDDVGAGIDAFVCIKYAGATKGTETVSDLNPEWNECIRLGCMLPNQSKAINVEVWDYDRFSKNDLISTFKVDFKSFQDKILPPKWANLYGPPQCAGELNKFADKMRLYGYEMGSHYCGRVLYSVGSYNSKHPKTKTSKIEFHFPDKPIASSPNKSYILRIDLLEAIDTPPRDKCLIYFTLGPYLIRGKVETLQNGRAIFYESLPDKKLVLPVNVDEIPDMIVYFADEDKEDRRHSYCRIPASQILINESKKHPVLKTIKLKEDKSLDLVDDSEFPGIVFAKVGLYSVTPPERKPVDRSNIDFQDYQLRVFVYRARNLPPADANGTSDPFFVINCAGQKGQTEIKENTLNPGFFETVSLDVKLPNMDKPQEVPTGFSVYLYDDDVKDNNEKDADLIGRSYIKIEPKWINYFDETTQTQTRIIYQKPKWHFIRYDATDTEQGEILIGYALIRSEDVTKVPQQPIYPKTIEHSIHLFIIGLRNINMDHFGFKKPNRFQLVLDVSGDKSDAATTEKIKVEGNIINANLHKQVKLDIPICKALAPNLDVQLMAHYTNDDFKLAGYCSLNIADQLQKFYITNNIPLAKPSTSLELKKQKNKDKPEEAPMALSLVESGKDGKEISTNKDGTDDKDGKKDKGGKDKDKGDKYKVKDKDKKAEPTKNVVTTEGLTKEVGQGQIKTINTFQINQNIEFDNSMREDDNDISLDEIVLGNQADEKKGFADDKKTKERGHKPKEPVYASGGDEKIIYEEFDTIEKEDLDVTPAWLLNREVKDDELEDFLKKNQSDETARILTFKMKTGSKRSKNTIDDEEPLPDPETEIANLKLIFLEGNADNDQAVQKYKSLMQQKEMICRVYILDAMELSRDDKPNEKPSTYLEIQLGDISIKEKEKTLRKDDYDPEYYRVYDIDIKIPGSPFLNINIWQDNEVLKDEILGTAAVDLEERYLNPEWQAMTVKPIEYRTLRRPNDTLPCGRISLWVEILDKTIKVPKFDISPLEKIDVELRAIVWECKGFEIADQGFGSSDLFIRGKLANQSEWLETDTHWRARAKAVFNWRWKFDMKLPVTARDYKGDILQIQLWDRDVMTSNTMLAETEINLNQHKMLDKCYKRRAPVKMRKKFYDKKESKYVETEVFWIDIKGFDPNNPNKTINKGKILMSLEVIPKDEAEKLKNALGRDAPNNFPNLPEPTGRFSFDIFSPLKTLKELVGEKYYRRLCCGIWMTICCIIVVAVGYFIGTSAVGSAIGSSTKR